MHLSIAVAMGLPFFSGIMASADAVLVSGATWVAIVGWLRLVITENPLARRLLPRLRRGRDSSPGAEETAAEEKGDAGEVKPAKARRAVAKKKGTARRKAAGEKAASADESDAEIDQEQPAQV